MMKSIIVLYTYFEFRAICIYLSHSCSKPSVEVIISLDDFIMCISCSITKHVNG